MVNVLSLYTWKYNDLPNYDHIEKFPQWQLYLYTYGRTMYIQKQNHLENISTETFISSYTYKYNVQCTYYIHTELSYEYNIHTKIDISRKFSIKNIDIFIGIQV